KAARELGLPVTLTQTSELPFPIKGAVSYANHAHFHPRKYLLGLIPSILANGGIILENTRALDVSDGTQCTVETDKGNITAGKVIVATHFPFLNRGQYFARMFPYRSYALAARIRGPVPQGMYYSTEPSVRSTRPLTAEEGDRLLVTGGYHKPGHVEDTIQAYKIVETYIRERFDLDAEVEYCWSTQDNETLDRVPYIGEFTARSRNLYCATGFGGWGMTGGTVSAMILSDLVLGRENAWRGLFTPSRFDTASIKTLVTENLDVGKHYFGDWVSAKRFSPEEVAPGESKVFKHGLEHVAVSRDEENRLTAVSGKCTHLGCLVKWNNAEESWDCPCHGSRFSRDGKLLHGPAVKDLEEKGEDLG
ncbi:MAG: FAD-dependent oxidoreductase, partial [Acidobacteriota bacterium]